MLTVSVKCEKYSVTLIGWHIIEADLYHYAVGFLRDRDLIHSQSWIVCHNTLYIAGDHVLRGLVQGLKQLFPYYGTKIGLHEFFTSTDAEVVDEILFCKVIVSKTVFFLAH